MQSSTSSYATVALVGPPNVGKSTIFNILTESRAALVADFAGVTRDPLAGQLQIDRHQITLVDTGGFSQQRDPLVALVNDRILAMINEAQLVLLVVEKASQPSDDLQQLVDTIRRANTPLVLVLNKSDRAGGADTTQWYRLHPDLLEISAVHRRGIEALRQRVAELLGKLPAGTAPTETGTGARVVITGRPNTGKSTLVNHLLGENRLITSDLAGTTRDVLAFSLTHQGTAYTLLDTPGVRRWRSIHAALEKFSVLKSMEALRQCDAGIVLIDGTQGLLEHDLKLLQRSSEIAPATLIGVNKIDALTPTSRAELARQISRRVPHLNHHPVVHISAQQGKGVSTLIQQALRLAQAAGQHFATSILMRTLEQATELLPPPSTGRFRPRLKFIHQVTPRRRLTFRISGNQAARIKPGYRAYLRNTLIKTFDLQGINIDIQLLDSHNPYTKKQP